MTLEDIQELRKYLIGTSHGPWVPGHLCDDTHQCNCTYIFNDGYMGSIARVSVMDGDNDSPPIEEAKANQRFISKFDPDMINDLLDELERLYNGK